MLYSLCIFHYLRSLQERSLMPYLHGPGLLTSGPLTAKETAEHQVRLSFGFVLLALAKPTGHILKTIRTFSCYMSRRAKFFKYISETSSQLAYHEFLQQSLNIYVGQCRVCRACNERENHSLRLKPRTDEQVFLDKFLDEFTYASVRRTSFP